MHSSDHQLSRRRFLEVMAAAGLISATGLGLAGCGDKTPAPTAFDIDTADWDALLAEARGKTVSFYGWGGDEGRNAWLDTTVADRLKTEYDITLKRVPMNINDILTQLSGEMQAGVEEGSIDFIWINGENFYSTMQNGYLYGPFCERLPNYTQYVDATSPEVSYDFGQPNLGFEAPYGKAQMVLLADTARTPELPATAADFLAFCQANAGKVTYPAAGDFTGTAFISTLIANAIGAGEWERLATLGTADEATIKGIIEPGLEYLRSLNPHLWQQGTTFPADSGTVYTMFQDGELVLHMTYDPFGWVNDVAAGMIPETTRSFLLEEGTVGNTNFLAIAKNASNKAAALVAINEVLSPETQLSQYETLKTVTVLDTAKLDADTQAAFEAVDLGTGTLPLDELLAHRIPEVAGPVLVAIEKLWTNEVVGK